MTQTTLQRLLKYPHAAVFDKAPGAELALRVRHPDGAVWSIAEEVLTVTAGNGDPVQYALADYTVGELADELVDAGFEIPLVASQWSSRSALALIEGSGSDVVSNGDHVSAFTSLLWALYSGYAGEMRDAKYQIGQALRQMVITQAEGEWLEVWGTLYGVGRTQDEVDGEYAPRIPQEAFRLRVNAYGIEQAVLDATGYDVRIREPWKNIFTLDESELSGPDKMYDGEWIGYHLIQPVSLGQVDWDAVLPVIARNKAAGVIVLSPQVLNGGYIDASQGVAVVGGLTRDRSALIPYEDRALLDFSTTLDDDSATIKNYFCRYGIREYRRFSQSVSPSQNWVGYTWPDSDSWGSLQYIVSSAHSRTYRAYYSSSTYEQTWARPSTWVSGAGGGGTYYGMISTELGDSLLTEAGDVLALDAVEPASSTWSSVGPMIFSDFQRRLPDDYLLIDGSDSILTETGNTIGLE